MTHPPIGPAEGEALRRRQVGKDQEDYSRVGRQCAVGQHPTAKEPQRAAVGRFDENEPADWEDDDFDDSDGGYCYRCDNQGFIVTCIDDMCRGCGECMHGDGETVCPDCKGDSAW